MFPRPKGRGFLGTKKTSSVFDWTLNKYIRKFLVFTYHPSLITILFLSPQT